ncbi:hypothetical protein [Rhodoferax koreensis]|uniref:hypothetical protein n=1 Tax=Rhodoferax koreensis TaxID=1842727 RepID=UPI0012FF669C|nr:hypothetical protein [Rhodoferax koreense]
MTADMDENGALWIRPETPAEAYLLRCWSDKRGETLKTAGLATYTGMETMVIVSSWPQTNH